MGRKGMTQTVGRIVPRDPCSGEILIHQHIDLRAEEVYPMTFRTWKEIEARGVMCPPNLERLLHIWGEVHNAIDLPFAAVDADRPCVEINGVPRQGTHFRDPEATAEH